MNHIKIFNTPTILPVENLPVKIETALSSYFKVQNINIIFITEGEMTKMNMEYRKINKPTDVLSFEINSEELLGEVYVCDQYILKEYDINEIYRVIIHGILHLYGYDHEKEFTTLSSKSEDMFVIQERILHKLLSII